MIAISQLKAYLRSREIKISLELEWLDEEGPFELCYKIYHIR